MRLNLFQLGCTVTMCLSQYGNAIALNKDLETTQQFGQTDNEIADSYMDDNLRQLSQTYGVFDDFEDSSEVKCKAKKSSNDSSDSEDSDLDTMQSVNVKCGLPKDYRDKLDNSLVNSCPSCSKSSCMSENRDIAKQAIKAVKGPK